MDSGQLYYATGEEIHIGDRVQYQGIYATVVVVSNGGTCELAPGYEDQIGAERGVIVCDDDGVTNSVYEADDQLILMNR